VRRRVAVGLALVSSLSVLGGDYVNPADDPSKK
jgi:hypothetical protein